MTHWELPNEDYDLCAYYFTDDSYSDANGINRRVHERLMQIGRYQDDKLITVISKSKIPIELWDNLLNSFRIENYPAILVSESPIGINDITLSDSFDQNFERNPVIAKIERDFILNRRQQNSDEIRDFLDNILKSSQLEDINSAEDLVTELEESRGIGEKTSGTNDEWNTLHHLGFCFEVAMYRVDKFIEENGLRGSVDEIKKRRWVVRFALTLYLLWYYMNHP